MSLSKVKLSAAMKRTAISLDEKIKVLDYVKAHLKMGCRPLAEKFNIGKTAAADILKNAKQLSADYESFKGTDKKKRRHGRYHLINEALYKWYKRCTAANIYPDGALLQEEALIIKNALWKDELDDFNASNG